MVLVVSAGLLLATMVLHVGVRWDRRRVARIRARWKPVFFGAMSGEALTVPAWSERESQIVLYLWLELTELVRGAARQRLAVLAQALNFERSALAWLMHGKRHRRMLAVSVLGRMQAGVASHSLLRLADDPDPVLSLMAVRSLLQIDAEGFLPTFLPQIAHRHDWPLVRIAAMLAEIPTEVLHPMFRQALQDHRSGSAVRLLRLLHTARIDGDLPTLRRFLYLMQPDDVLEAALVAARSPQLVGAVRALRGHPSARVRAQAAAALGRIGAHEDTLQLLLLLGDPDWPVRYQAARALARLPGLDDERLDALHAVLATDEARAMLTQARAELSHRARERPA